jgi:2-aminoadipate transaminase
MAERGVICTEHQVLLTSGAQQALDLMARLLLRKGSDVLLEEMTFPGIRQAIEPFNARISTVRSDPQTGIDLADLKCKLKTARPAFLYAIPQGHNPLGTNIPANNRSELIKIAQRHGLLILEDDTYGFLSLEGNTTKPLRAFDDDLIIYIGSFSKIFAPGLRLGWMVVPERFMEKLALLRDLAEINTSSFGQRVMAEILQTGGLQDHIKCLRSIYRQKRDAMCEALSMHLGEAAKWTVPESGFFVWVRFHDGVDLVKLFESTLRDEHTAFAPGIAFAGESGGVLHPCARLSFSYASKEDINLGIEGLARALQRVR